jgi:hypothetical protein
MNLSSKRRASIRHLPIKLLEIGVENGCSIKMWEEYFPNGEIYGLASVRRNQLRQDPFVRACEQVG